MQRYCILILALWVLLSAAQPSRNATSSSTFGGSATTTTPPNGGASIGFAFQTTTTTPGFSATTTTQPPPQTPQPTQAPVAFPASSPPAANGPLPAGANGPRLKLPPPMPSAWPGVDNAVLLSGAVLADPLVTDALAYVKSVVPESVLAIPPSTQIDPTGPATIYNSDAVANCYWPKGPCVRANATAYYSPDVYACPQANTWGITYDDGPLYINGTNDTPDLLNHLKQQNIKATFFCVGSNSIKWPDQVYEAYKEGHEIAVHTWTHHPMTSLTNEQVVAEIKYTEAIIYKSIGLVPALWRPPYGDIDDRIRAITWALGYRTAIWTTTPLRDTGDTAGGSSDAREQEILGNVTQQFFPAQPGFVSLQHDISNYTTNVAIKILDLIGQARSSTPPTIGVTPMPVGQCMNIQSYQGSQTPPSGFVPPTPSGLPSGTRNGNTTFSAPKISGAVGCGRVVVSILLVGVVVVVLVVMVVFM
ncbi:chitin deacetylase [Rhizophlyctis rosea]|uniref:Chitin deacetylase n=1 Tax=Rhizophlyctis rosea TaxID=64517 RepID=A0AAD5X432_9FUNG|nr:chitin deacetylase [Rhizophlyctis rosea]